MEDVVQFGLHSSVYMFSGQELRETRVELFPGHFTLPMHAAVYHGHIDLLESLTTHGVDLEQRDEHGRFAEEYVNPELPNAHVIFSMVFVGAAPEFVDQEPLPHMDANNIFKMIELWREVGRPVGLTLASLPTLYHRIRLTLRGRRLMHMHITAQEIADIQNHRTYRERNCYFEKTNQVPHHECKQLVEDLLHNRHMSADMFSRALLCVQTALFSEETHSLVRQLFACLQHHCSASQQRRLVYTVTVDATYTEAVGQLLLEAFDLEDVWQLHLIRYLFAHYEVEWWTSTWPTLPISSNHTIWTPLLKMWLQQGRGDAVKLIALKIPTMTAEEAAQCIAVYGIDQLDECAVLFRKYFKEDIREISIPDITFDSVDRQVVLDIAVLLDQGGNVDSLSREYSFLSQRPLAQVRPHVEELLLRRQKLVRGVLHTVPKLISDLSFLIASFV